MRPKQADSASPHESRRIEFFGNHRNLLLPPVNLFDRTPFAWPKAIEWAGRDEEFVKRAGFAMMAALAALVQRAGKSTPTQIAMEERMGCSMGVCLGCVVACAGSPPDSSNRRISA